MATTLLAPEVRIACTPADVAQLREPWERLQHHPNADFAAEHTLLAVRGAAAAPFILSLGAVDAPRALLVARLQHTRLPVRFGYRTVARPKVRAVEVLRGGQLGAFDAEVATAFTRALMAALRGGTADLVRFEHLPTASPMYAAARAAGARMAAPQPDRHWRVAIPETWEAFARARSSNTRHNLKRYPKRFLAEFGTRCEVVVRRDPAELDAIMRELEAVSAATYHRGLGAGFVASAEKRALVELALREGDYRAWVLRVDGEPAAFWDGRRYRGTFHTETTGYLPKLEEARPGWFLLARVVADLCADPEVSALDFGVGDAQYKRMLCDESWDEAPLALYAPTLRGIALRTAVGLADWTARRGRWLLDRTGLTEKLKRRWRKRLATPVTSEDPPAVPSRTPLGS